MVLICISLIMSDVEHLFMCFLAIQMAKKAMVFSVVMCGYESWTIKKVEHRRIDAFELWF